MPNPWIVVGALLALIGVALGGYFYGEHVENLSWTATVEKQHAQAATELAKATAETAAVRHKLDEINTQVETDHADHQAALDAAFAENQRLTGELKRVLDGSGSGTGGADTVPGSAQSATSSRQLPASYRALSGTVADILNRGTLLARDADREANAATECHEWAVKVSAAGGAE